MPKALSVSAPPIKAIHEQNVLKLDMHVHILNIESMNPTTTTNLEILGESWGATAPPPIGATGPDKKQKIMFHDAITDASIKA